MSVRREGKSTDDHIESLDSLAKLRNVMTDFERLESQITALRGHKLHMPLTIDSLITKTAALEELRSEKRILRAEREESLRRLLEIQKDLEDVTSMEEKVLLETQKVEREITCKLESDEYLQTRGNIEYATLMTKGQISELLQKHNLPELPRLPRNQDEENVQYLQSRLHQQQIFQENLR